MPLINDSHDLLNIVIALSVLLFTIFSCWAIYYLARILQQMFKVIKETRDRLNKFDELVKMIKEKIEHSASYLPLIVDGVKKLVDLMKSRAEKKKKSK
jgi:predicted PurR-regulated permease PerM